MKTTTTDSTTTSAAQHTPGPWTCDPVTERVLQKTYGTFRVFSGGEEGMPVQRTEANARLIAAAPDLLAACQEALALLNNPDADGFDADQIDGILNRAIQRATT